MTIPFVVPPDDGGLLLVVNNEKPIPAKLLGELLGAMAADYRRLNRGRTLVVAELRTGSLWAKVVDAAQTAAPALKDAAEVAKGAKAIVDFGQSLTGLLKKSKAKSAGDLDFESRHPLARSLENIVKMSIDAEAQLDLVVRLPDGASAEVHLVPKEARRIRSETEANQAALRQALDQAQLVDGRPAEPRRLRHRQSAEVADAILSLPAAQGRLGLETRDAIQALVGALRSSGMLGDVSLVAAALDVRGRSDIATLLRQSGSGDTSINTLT